MAKIQAPNPDFRGTRHGVVFRSGKAETDDPVAIASLLQAGYLVTDVEEQVHEEDPTVDTLGDLKVKELRALAAEEGIVLAGVTTKAEIIEVIEAARAAV